MLMSERESYNILDMPTPLVFGLADPVKYPDLYELLGLPEPTLGETHKRGDVPLFDWVDPYAWDWIKKNRALLAIVGVGLVIIYLSFRR